ncbi:hypothetical protein [Actinomadura livida]|uniref:Uncharacterized protein n=1 Tax=Actinomadura livida TaxID=79909 RepID=A0A7W7MYG0_9ACTN|nr:MULTISPECIES: hypothetical protein [Actinomadura]MBB4774785.1 hypothetical protein [Actinomadura catellatispora]GGU06006.1 hypothetical protein GCM10010208_32880 [Actinomadura livida]
MTEAYVREPDPPNLSVGTRESYAFSVEATIGQRNMRYLIGRRFGGHTAVTVLLVSHPATLAGTHVWITEDAAAGSCRVVTYVPTMKTPIQLVERHVLGCLPLTDIGYLDLMAWRYPGLGPGREGAPADISWSRWDGASARSYPGPSCTPGLTVTEATDRSTRMVVARAVERLGTPVRRWEVLELGDPDTGRLPRRIRVSRPQTGHWTELRRTTEPVDVPAAAFETGPDELGETIEAALDGRAA